MPVSFKGLAFHKTQANILTLTAMLSNEDMNLRPDEHLLHKIFPQSQSTRTTVLAQTFDNCTFIAHQCGSSEEDVVVRLEISESSDDSNRFRTIAALQTIARLAIPDLVPTIERYGTTTTADGRNVNFSVTKFIHDTVTLESVWDDLEEEQQVRIVKELLEATKKLHAIKLSDSTVVQILEGTGFAPPSSESRAIGGPNTGYFTDIPGFLGSIIQSHWHSHLSSDSATGNITIHSEYDDINPVLIPSDDLQHLQDSVVLCHNDLEPRNILVHPKELDNGTTSYFIAAIIDWEMSGFFPFSYEYVYKDLFLGNSNLYFTWYALFKEYGAPLVPMSRPPLPTSHALFMEAIELIHYSHDRGKQPMSGQITKKWIAREGVVRQQPAGRGWLKKDGQPSKRIPEAEMDKLVDQILKERARS